jgi:hypothetical protein
MLRNTGDIVWAFFVTLLIIAGLAGVVEGADRYGAALIAGCVLAGATQIASAIKRRSD